MCIRDRGESETLEMSFAISDMSSYDDIGETGHKSAYVMEAGDYDIYVGDSIKDAGEKGVRDTYNVAETTVTEQLTEKLAPTQLPERLMADGKYHEIEVAPGFDPHHTIAAEGQTVVQSEAMIGGDVTVESFYNDDFERLSCIAMMNAAGKYLSLIHIFRGRFRGRGRQGGPGGSRRRPEGARLRLLCGAGRSG